MKVTKTITMTDNKKIVIPDGRYAVIFDTPYLYHATKKQSPDLRIDYTKIMVNLDEEWGIRPIKAIAVVSDTRNGDEENPGFDGFLGVLRWAGIEPCVSKARQSYRTDDGGGRYDAPKNDCNMSLAIEAMAIAERVDNIVLGTGNGDFIPLVKKLSQLGRNIIVLSYLDTTSKDMLKLSTAHIEIDDYAMASKKEAFER